MTPNTLSGIISEAAAQTPERPAVHAGERFLTYGELESGVEGAAARMEESMVAGERVGLLLPNLVSFPLAFYGTLRAGASVLLLNPLSSAREIGEQLQDCGARTVVATERLSTLVPAGVRVMPVHELTAAEGGSAAASSEEKIPLEAAEGGDSEAVVVYTSATEGWARGARLSHANLLANARSTVEAMRLTPEDRVVAALPLVHLFGLTVTLNAPFLAGAAVLPLERFSPARVLELIERERATVICGVPAMYRALLAAVERRGEVPAHALRLAICGGAPLPLEVGRRWEESFGIPLRQGYGLTEGSPVCLFDRTDRPPTPGTLGHPFPGVEVSIRDEPGHELPAGEVGEICVRGANVFLGYVGESGRHPRDLHEDWLRTGDLGSLEAGGVIRFRGYLKPMFTRNGFNIYPRELERALQEDPRIADVSACARPDLARENEIVLYVRPARNARLSEEELRARCAERLASYKQPAEIFFVVEEPPDG